MDDLIEQIATKTGIDRGAATKAVGIIASFLRSEAPAAKADALINKLPGVQALADSQGKISGGLFGAFNALSAAGLGMTDIQAVAREFGAYARAKAGEKEVNDLVASIPGIGQFL